MRPWVFLALCACSTTQLAPSRVVRPIFTADEELELELGEETLSAGADRVRVRVERIGQLSRAVCTVPKLAVHLLDDSARFGAAGGRLFLFGHCNDAELARGMLPGPEVVGGERIARAIGIAFGQRMPGARAARIKYRGDAERHPALIIEDLLDLAARDGATIEIPGDPLTSSSTRTIDRDALARLHLFEIAINNADWAIFELRPLMRRLRRLHNAPLHNVALLHGSTLVPIAIDFDLATIVRDPMDPGMSERHLVTGEPWLDRWMEMQLEDFARVHGAAAAKRAIAHVRERLPAAREAIEALAVDEKAKARARDHLDAFAKAL